MLPWFENAFPLYLAPMAGVTDHVFRQICKRFGADVLVTEFVAAEGILHRNRRTSEFLAFDPCERPLGVQLFGGDPGRMAEATRAVLGWVSPDFIDLNFGCPVRKVVAKNGGSSLLRDCPLLERVALAVVRAADPVPVTAKIRIGWDEGSINAPEVARLLEECGIAALAVHGRTRQQGYSGRARWDVIAEVAARVRIPVIGNGDIASAADALHRKTGSGVRGLMIGRAAMGNPWIFREIKHAMAAGRDDHPRPGLEERWALVLHHATRAVEARGAERPALHSMRARLMAYSRGMPEGKSLREQLSAVETLDGLRAIRDAHLAGHGEVSGPRVACLT